MNPFERFGGQFKLAGNVTLDACPVCGSTEIAELWRLPQNRLSGTTHLSAPGTKMDKLYLQYLPLLQTPQEIYRFDICGQCESIFLNPKHDDQATYLNDTSKVRSFVKNGPDEFASWSRRFVDMLPKDTRLVIDAACGAGQVLWLMRELRPDLRYLGLELSEPSVRFMRDDLGLEAHQADLDRDDLDGVVAPGTADFIVVQEAYEHVRSPIVLMKKMARMLRPGGRLWLTAQYWGDNELQIRVGEPIYINDVGFDYTLEQCGLKLVSLKKDIKIRALLEKP